MGIRQSQSENFKKNYVGEMKLVINFLENKIKSNEELSLSEAEEAKAIINENIDKFQLLDKYPGE